jgi:hypothetical protein
MLVLSERRIRFGLMYTNDSLTFMVQLFDQFAEKHMVVAPDRV